MPPARERQPAGVVLRGLVAAGAHVAVAAGGLDADDAAVGVGADGLRHGRRGESQRADEADEKKDGLGLHGVPLYLDYLPDSSCGFKKCV
jgi:hypothetical protein